MCHSWGKATRELFLTLIHNWSLPNVISNQTFVYFVNASFRTIVDINFQLNHICGQDFVSNISSKPIALAENFQRLCMIISYTWFRVYLVLWHQNCYLYKNIDCFLNLMFGRVGSGSNMVRWHNSSEFPQPRVLHCAGASSQEKTGKINKNGDILFFVVPWIR